MITSHAMCLEDFNVFWPFYEVAQEITVFIVIEKGGYKCITYRLK